MFQPVRLLVAERLELGERGLRLCAACKRGDDGRDAVIVLAPELPALERQSGRLEEIVDVDAEGIEDVMEQIQIGLRARNDVDNLHFRDASLGQRQPRRRGGGDAGIAQGG